MEHFTRMSKKELSIKKKEEWALYCKILRWGRSNPVKFAEEVFGIKLMDYQAWVMMNSWYRPFVMWIKTRGAGKDALGAIYYMCKMLLIPSFRVYISALSAPQAMESFRKLEDIAMQRIPEFRSANDVFAREIEKSGQNKDGFIHDPMGYKFRLFNNSEMITVSSNIDTTRGKRGSVWFNEVGWQSEEHLAVISKFASTDSNFSTSTDKTQLAQPPQIPLQLLYTTSASDVSFKIYDLYKQYSMKMFEGDPRYFVCDIDANDVLNYSTIDGHKIKAHLSEDLIEQAIEEDPEAADRELFNKFRRGGGDKAAVSMEAIMRNSHVRKPELYNVTGKDKYIFCYDPARAFDNSVLGIFKVIKDKDVGYKLELVNMISMVDRNTKKKTPLPMPEQLKIIKRALIAYNGDGVPDYENIMAFYIDAGAGGGGVSAVADNLMADWVDDMGITRRGIIDPEHKQYETSRKTYFNAYPIVRLVEPRSHKVIAYEALSELFKLNLISLTQYDRRDFILINGEEDTVTELNEGTETRSDKKIKKSEMHVLSDDEKEALIQIELAKTELSYMIRDENFKTKTITFELMKSKQNKLNDDRSYVLSLAGYALKQLRRNEINKKKKTKENNFDFKIRQPKIK